MAGVLSAKGLPKTLAASLTEKALAYLRGKPKLARLTNEAEPDVLAFMSFPSSHRVKLHSMLAARMRV